jgi:hypothetical protein
LTSEETNKLNDIGFSDPKNNERLVKTITFEKRLEELKAYKDKYGTLYIHSRNPEFQSLYNWKKQIIHSKILNEKQRGQLRELGVFDKHPTQRIVANKDFDIRYKELQDYKDKFGTTHISRTNKEYKKLYNWVHHVKRRAKLTTKQIELLMTIGINVKKTKESE